MIERITGNGGATTAHEDRELPTQIVFFVISTYRLNTAHHRCFVATKYARMFLLIGILAQLHAIRMNIIAPITNSECGSSIQSSIPPSQSKYESSCLHLPT